MSHKTILIAAGGTGGHMFPAKAFADEMAKNGVRVVLITDPRGKKYIDGFPSADTLILPVTNAEEGGVFGKIKGAFSLINAIMKTAPFIKIHAPDVVVGFGGYPTFPALWCAKCPIVIHEQNGILGRVNKFFQGKAKKIFSGFQDLKGLSKKKKQSFVGNPVRAELVAAREAPYPDIAENGTIRILITGGSQGARVLGQIIPEAIAALPEDLRIRLFISHQVREEQADWVRETYADAGIEAEVWPFFKDMASRIKNAHYIIGRAGASTVSETAIVGRAALFIPLPTAMNDHQTYNAKTLEATGGADVIKESELNLDGLIVLLMKRLSDTYDLKERALKVKSMGKPEATQQMAREVLEIIEG